ncbi:MAG: aromatic aminobenezylarsenical efflux permease ArsG family transporter [Actinomycetota bacterium]
MRGKGLTGSSKRRVVRMFILFVPLILIILVPSAASLASGEEGKAAEDGWRVELLYFYPRFRCLSCEQVESYAEEAASSYRGHGREGIPFQRLAIDDPANRGLVERYGVVGSSLYLVLKRGDEERFRELKEVWFKWEDREGCVSYIHSELDRVFEEGLPSENPAIILAGIPLLAALLLGILTAVSPCPLATNLAAVAYIARDLGKRGRAMAAGALYTLGRALTYVALGVLLVYLGANVVRVSDFLRNSSVYYLGPLLIFASLVMLDVIHLSFFRGGRIARLGEKLTGHGALGALPLGAIFALSFCPYSAVLFFGMLIPLAVGTPVGGLYLPALYAVGTSLPVLAVALAIAFGAGAWAGHVDRIQKWEKHFRRGAGLVFLGVGIYYSVLLVKTVW